MIVLLSHAGDLHTQAVQQELERLGAPSVVVDLSTFPTRSALRLTYTPARAPQLWLDLADGSLIDLNACRAVWWRRPQAFEVADLDAAARRFAYNECAEAFDGLWHAVDTAWLNPPLFDGAAHKKTYQLAVASRLGMDVPRTLVTNAPDAAREFLTSAPDGAIYKPFSATAEEWRETRLVGPEELSQLDLVQHAPVIFQEYVAGVDLRVTVVGDRVFAAAIDVRGSGYPVDFRMAMDEAAIVPTELPADVERQLLALMKRLGLVYGAVDYRRTADGRHVFLEVNPAGQWLFVELATGQPITEAIAAYLADPPRMTEEPVEATLALA